MSNLQKIIRESLELSDEVPEDYKKDTFLVILRHLLKTQAMFESDEEANLTTSNQGVGQADNWLERIYENIPDSNLIANKGNRDQQTIWAVISLHSRNQETIVNNIQDIIRTELGIAPQSRSNTSEQLRRLIPKYLYRQQRSSGRGFIYEPTSQSLEIFDGLLNEPS
jgi:hypothetical protein